MGIVRARGRRRWLAAGGAALALGGLRVVPSYGSDNLGVVAPGVLYRSGRLGAATLDRLLRAERIRTVINLEGGDARHPWYRAEAAVCRRRNVRYVRLWLSGEALPEPWGLRHLLETFDRAPRPALVRCRRGADRTGLAATLFRHLYLGVPLPEAARRELAPRYGHFDAGFGAGHSVQEFLRLYRRTATGPDLREWILGRYPQLYARAMGPPREGER